MTDFDRDGPPRSRRPRPYGAGPGGRRAPQAQEKRPPWLAPRHLHEWPETSCGCDDCKEACLNSPGWFLPEQLERVADYLNLTLEALFRKFLAVSVTELPDGSRRHGVMPHKLRDHKKPGAIWTLPELSEPGRCVFYDRGKCTIYPVRPFECSRMLHSHRKELKTLRRQVVERWTREALRVYESWVGRRLFPKHQPAGDRAGRRAGEQPHEQPGRRGQPPADEARRPGGLAAGRGRGERPGPGNEAPRGPGQGQGQGRGRGRGPARGRGRGPQHAAEPPVDRNPHELPSPPGRAQGTGGRPGGRGRRFPPRRRMPEIDDD